MTYKDISPEEALAIMQQNPNVKIIDVRTPAEFATGFVRGAVNIPLDQIEAGQIPELMSNPEEKYLLYCRSGRRSGLAAEILSARGYKDVSNFGGVIQWPYELIR